MAKKGKKVRKTNMGCRRGEGTKQQSGKNIAQDDTCVPGPEQPVQITWEKAGVKERTVAKKLKANLLC